jgi:hypothetical protein
MSNGVNHFYTLIKILEKDIDYDLVKDAIEKYVNIAKRSGEKPDDVIMKIKNASIGLNDTILDICVTLQGSIESNPPLYNTDEWISVNEAAVICGVEPATVRNWTKQASEPLQAKKLSDRKTIVLASDLKRFATTHNPQSKNR